MAIGPDSRRMASGRVVVAAALEGVIGAFAVLVGVGPFAEPADEGTRRAAAAAIALGSASLVGGVVTGLRIRLARAVGQVGGLAVTLLGLLVVAAAVPSLDDCAAMADAASCYMLIGVVAVAGLTIALVGLACIVVIRRAPPSALRGSRR